MKLLNREQFFAAPKGIVMEDVAVPELGEGAGVRIRSLTAASRGMFIKRSLELREKSKSGADADIEKMIVAMSAVDEEDKQIFTEADVQALGEYSAAVITRLAEVAMRLSGMTGQAQEQASKNFEPVPS